MSQRNKDLSVSFVIPVFNSQDTLYDAVKSIFDSNYIEGDEVIIVNDASTDITTKVISELKHTYKINVINNEKNLGCPTSRNIGITQARNSLIFSLDSDNVLAPGSIIKLRQEIIQNQVEIATFSEIRFFTNHINKITHRWQCKTGIFTLSDLMSGMINPGPAGNYLFTKNCWQDVKGYYELGSGLNEAWGFTLKLLAHHHRMMVVPNSYYYHRHGHDSLYVRESKNLGESSKIAALMLAPFEKLIEPSDLIRIKTTENKKTWFDQLNNRPLKVKGMPMGQNGKVLYPWRWILRQKLHRFLVQKMQSLKYLFNYFIFKRNYNHDRGFLTGWSYRYPCLNDNTQLTSFDRHYVYFPAWALRVLTKIKPIKHIDISSSLSFCSMASSIYNVDFYDYRPANLQLDNLTCKQADLNNLPFRDNSVLSLSCMHVVEHIGLGRYGDKIDADGDLKAINELKRVLAKNGNLLFVVPIGKPMIRFNAHRIYSYQQIATYFRDLELKELMLISNSSNRHLIYNATEAECDKETYGCGCFWFKKP